MKRYGDLFGRVCDFQALCTAARSAAKGKKAKGRVAQFLLELEPEIIAIKTELIDMSYRPRPYHTVEVGNPKRKMICVVDFRGRVVHHAVCTVLEMIFERSFIHDSYACRIGKGSHAAIQRAQYFTQRYAYCLKLDVQNFFDSIDHEVLKHLLRRRINDKDLLWLLDVFVDHPVPGSAPGKGIPIGNLTSQYFANFYLDSLDHLIKDELGIKGYIRYMGDILLFAESKPILWRWLNRIEAYLSNNLKLEIKPTSVRLAPVSEGFRILGFRMFPGVLRLSRNGFRRFRSKVVRVEQQYRECEISQDELMRSMASLFGCIQTADTRNLRALFF